VAGSVGPAFASAPTPLIGVLAIQGDFEAHATALERLGAKAAEVRRPADLEDLDGLVIPGGESTTMEKGIEAYGSISPYGTSLPRDGGPSSARVPG